MDRHYRARSAALQPAVGCRRFRLGAYCKPQVGEPVARRLFGGERGLSRLRQGDRDRFFRITVVHRFFRNIGGTATNRFNCSVDRRGRDGHGRREKNASNAGACNPLREMKLSPIVLRALAENLSGLRRAGSTVERCDGVVAGAQPRPLPTRRALRDSPAGQLRISVGHRKANKRSGKSPIAAQTRTARGTVSHVENGMTWGQATAMICDYAKERAIVQIVIGAPDRSAFNALLVGGVCSQALHHALCPVTVVRLTGARRGPISGSAPARSAPRQSARRAPCGRRQQWSPARREAAGAGRLRHRAWA